MKLSQIRRDIDGEEPGEPDCVDEMPIDSTYGDRGMALAVEIAKLRPDQQNQQHQYSDNHMGQMETSDGEIKRAVWAGVELVRLVQPLDQLHAHEDETKHDAAKQPERQS